MSRGYTKTAEELVFKEHHKNITSHTPCVIQHLLTLNYFQCQNLASVLCQAAPSVQQLHSPKFLHALKQNFSIQVFNILDIQSSSAYIQHLKRLSVAKPKQLSDPKVTPIATRKLLKLELLRTFNTHTYNTQEKISSRRAKGLVQKVLILLNNVYYSKHVLVYLKSSLHF